MSHAIVPSCKCDVIKMIRHVYRGGSNKTIADFPAVSFRFEYINTYIYQARALRALGLLLADGAPTVGGGKTF